MIGVVVDYNLVTIPQPVIGVVKIEWGQTENAAGDPEAISVVAFDPKDVSGAEASREPSMLEGMVQMEAGIVPPIIMTHPLAICVNVGGLRVPLAIAEAVVFNGTVGAVRRFRAMLLPGGRRAMTRNVSTAHTMFLPRLFLPPSLLCKHGD